MIGTFNVHKALTQPDRQPFDDHLDRHERAKDRVLEQIEKRTTNSDGTPRCAEALFASADLQGITLLLIQKGLITQEEMAKSIADRMERLATAAEQTEAATQRKGELGCQ